MKISVLGAARIKCDSPVYQQAFSLGKILALKKYKLTAGGGKGIMEAISIPYRLNPDLLNSVCIESDQNGDECYKWNGYGTKILVKSIKEQSSILINNQDMIIIFPGGTGTIQELFYILTSKIYLSTKVILIGRNLKELVMFCIKSMGNDLFDLDINKLVFLDNISEMNL